jgi:hypothetical protein
MTAYVVYWSEFQATDPKVSSSIPSATRFSEKQWFWNGVHSASWVQVRSYLEEKVAAPVQKGENTAVEIRHADRMAYFIRNSRHYLPRQAAVAPSV